MTDKYHFRCTLCGATYGAGELSYVCPKHADAGVLDTLMEFGNRPITRANLPADSPASMWRYADLLPIDTEHVRALVRKPSPLASAGWTPLHLADRLGARLGVQQLHIKDEGRNPSGSLKDRASALVVARALVDHQPVLTAASSGNAGAALACMAASAGLRSVIFVPETAPQAKVAQLLMFGAEVFLVRGTYDDAFELCLAASKHFGWYCRNTAYNPFTVEGKKTVAFEIAEQLNWHVPDRVVVSVGDGNILSGVHKGFGELRTLGWTDRVPKLTGVQAAGSDACYRAWSRAQAGSEVRIESVAAQTIADSISVGLPRDGIRAVGSVRESAGEFVRVSDYEILAAMKVMATECAVFAEPAGAAALAGLVKLAEGGKIAREETVAVIATGNGLKDIPAALTATGPARVIDPSLEALQAAIHSH